MAQPARLKPCRLELAFLGSDGEELAQTLLNVLTLAVRTGEIALVVLGEGKSLFKCFLAFLA